MGTAFVHTVIDDHSRVACAEIHDDETALTATGVLHNAVTWFAARGISIERVLSDNGSAYVSHLWRDVCAQLGIKHSRTRPYRPQTNGKIERFHRTLADGWGYARCYGSDELMRAEQAAHRPYVPRFTPVDAKQGWDYAPQIAVNLDTRGNGLLPAAMTRRMPPTLRAVAGADSANASAVGRLVQEPGQRAGVVRAYVDVAVWPWWPPEGGDNQLPDPGPPALRYSLRAPATEQAAATLSESLDRIWGADRWGREWSPALASAEPVEINWPLIDGLRPFVATWQHMQREDPRNSMYRWLQSKLLSPHFPSPLAAAAQAYSGSRVLLDTLLALAMPVQREYEDIVRATLDGLPLTHGGVGIPLVQDIAEQLVTPELEGGPHPGGAGEGRLVEAVTRLTGEPLAALRTSLDKYRKDVAAGTESLWQPLLEQSMSRLTVSQGIVTTLLRVAELDQVNEPTRQPTSPAPTTSRNPTSYTVKVGDTLSSIARTFHIAGGWRRLYEMNKDVKGPDPNMLKVGAKLKVQ